MSKNRLYTKILRLILFFTIKTPWALAAITPLDTDKCTLNYYILDVMDKNGVFFMTTEIWLFGRMS